MPWGSSAADNFKKIVKQKQQTAKKMERGPYERHAKPPLKEARDVSNWPKGKSMDWYKSNGYIK